MEFLSNINPLYVASSFGVGMIVGLTGVGGGALMTPILILLFGVHPAAAVGTDLLYASVTKSGGSVVHSLNKTIHWPIVGKLALGSVPAALATLLLFNVLGINSAGTSALVSKVLGVALILTALALIFRGTILRAYAKRAGVLSPQTTTILTIATGAILGVLVTISSVGAGALGVTALVLLYPEIPISRIVGSDIAHAVPLTLVAGAGHWLLGSVDFALLGSLLIGSLPGIVIASSFVPRTSDRVLRFLLAAVLTAVSIKLLA